MRDVRVTIAMALIAALAAMFSPLGCSSKGRDLAFANERDTPVVTYSSHKAIAPVYNPSVPVSVIYPDRIIRKDGPYDLRSARMTREQVGAVLERLDELGFFDLKKEYRNAEPLAGGTTETVSVMLESGTYAVLVEGGAGPPGWNDIVDSVTNARASDFEEYVPLSLILHASEADAPGDGVEVKPWPGDPADLANAAEVRDGSARGAALEGDRAAAAWAAVSSSFSEDGAGGETLWSAGDKVYLAVYATPVLPGVKTGD